MKAESFYIGNFKNDAETSGHKNWFIGEFIKEGARKTKAVEIKYWEFESGQTSHKTKIQGTIECTIILKGEIEGEVDGQEIKLQKGDYVVIKPGTPNNLVKHVVSLVKGLTIKAPSDPSAKEIA